MRLENISDLNSTFGLKLPTPYIDQVKVYSDYITVQISMYLSSPEGDTEKFKNYVNRINKYLNSIQLYCIIDGKVPEENYATYPIYNLVNDGRTYISSAIRSKQNSILEFKTGEKQTLLTDFGDLDIYYDYSNVTNYELSLFEVPAEPSNTSGQNYIYKLTAEQEVAFYDSSDPTSRNKLTLELFSNNQCDLNLFCFAAPENLVDWSDVKQLFWETTSTTDSGYEIGKINYSADFKRARTSISNLSHQTVFSSGSLRATESEIYENSQGNVHSGDVIQSIDGTYHSWTDQQREGMVESFTNLVISSSNEEIKQIANSLSYLVSQFGEATDFIPRLYSFYKVSPYKTNVTEAGSYFESVSGLMFKTNRRIQGSEALTKKIVYEPTVLDLRGDNFLNVSLPFEYDYDYLKGGQFIYVNDSLLMHRNGYFEEQNRQGTTQEFSSTEDYDVFNRGFVLFDFEKAIRTQTKISKFFDVAKLDNYFGRAMTAAKFVPSKALIKRFKRNEELDDWQSGDAVPSLGSDNGVSTVFQLETTFNKESAFDFESMKVLSHADSFYTTYEFNDFINDSNSSEVLCPYFIPRNFKLASADSKFVDYRLLCYDFFHIVKNSGPATEDISQNDILSFETEFIDYTREIYYELTSSYQQFLTGAFAKYVDVANEFCHYNNIDNYFNDFFAESMIDAYESNPASAPWVVAPIIFNLHLDLLTDQWQGSADTILIESKNNTNNIGPSAGTLEQLNAFYEKMVELNTQFYDTTTGVIGSVHRTELYGDPAVGFTSAGGASYTPHPTYSPLPHVDFLNLTAEATRLSTFNLWLRMSSFAEIERNNTTGEIYWNGATTQPFGEDSTAEQKTKDALLFYAEIIYKTEFRSSIQGNSSYYPAQKYLTEGGLVGMTSEDNRGGLDKGWNDYYAFVASLVIPASDPIGSNYSEYPPDMGDHSREWDGTLIDAIQMFARIAWPNDYLNVGQTKTADDWGEEPTDPISIDTMQLLKDNGYYSP
jgi:hypothetical protein